jgi:hypothetical protein
MLAPFAVCVNYIIPFLLYAGIIRRFLMGIANQQTQQPFPFPYDGVFRALYAVLPECGFTIRHHDINIGRISVSTGMSALSWGENLTLVVQPIDEQNAMVSIDSSLKVGINLAASHRHHHNFDNILISLGRCLQHWQSLGYFENPSKAVPGMYNK